MNTYWIYIMMNKSNSVNYTGITNDLERRVWEHKNSTNVNSFTSKYNINKLVYFEDFYTPESAIAREKQIKGLSREKKLNLIKEMNPEFKDLSEEWYQDETK
ncbi:MAG: GIY-YIG nuclease family protein [Candidatus Parcubacteria bacterium]|nr:GIY-YIG nuclease family protein [Candidatus Parcubacteria bacterium]